MASRANAVEECAQQIARSYKFKPEQVGQLKQDIYYFALANWHKLEKHFLVEVNYCQAEAIPVSEFFIRKMQQRRRK